MGIKSIPLRCGLGCTTTPTPVSRPKTLLIALVIGLVLGGCSTTLAKLAYPRLDWGLVHFIQSFFSPTTAQHTEIEVQSKKVLDWHCREQLPMYARWLDLVQRQIESGQLTSEQLHLRVLELHLFWTTLAGNLAHAFTPLAASLTPDQIKAIEQTFTRKNAEEQHQIKSEEADRTYQIKRLGKVLGYWIGTLSSEQERKLNSMSDRLRLVTQVKWANRMARREQLLQWLSSNNGSSALEPKLGRWLSYRSEDWTPEYRDSYQHNETLILDLLDWLLQNLTEEQLQYLRHRLADWSQTLKNLSCTG